LGNRNIYIVAEHVDIGFQWTGNNFCRIGVNNHIDDLVDGCGALEVVLVKSRESKRMDEHHDLPDHCEKLKEEKEFQRVVNVLFGCGL